MKKLNKKIALLLVPQALIVLMLLGSLPPTTVTAYDPQVDDQAEYSMEEYMEFNLDITLYSYNMSTGELLHVMRELRQGFDDLWGRDQFKILEVYTRSNGDFNVTKVDHVGIFNGTHVENVTRDHYDPFSDQWDNSSNDDEYWNDTFGGSFRNPEVYAEYNQTYYPVDGPGPYLGQGQIDLMYMEMPWILDPEDSLINLTWQDFLYNASYFINDVEHNLTIKELSAIGYVLYPEVIFTFMKEMPPENETNQPPPLGVAQNPGEPPPPPPPNFDVTGYNVSLFFHFNYLYDFATGMLVGYYEYVSIVAESLYINGTAMVPMSPPPPPPPSGDSSTSTAQQYDNDSFVEVYVEGEGTFNFTRSFGLTLAKHSRLYGGYDFSGDDLFEIVPLPPPPTTTTTTSPDMSNRTTPTSSMSTTTTVPSNDTGADNETAGNTTAGNVTAPTLVTPGFELVPFVATVSVFAVVVHRIRRKKY